MTLPRLEPAHPVERLYPANAAFAARADLEQTRMLGYTPFNQDAVTTLLLGLLHKRPTVRHRSGVTDDILELMQYAGHVICENMYIYDSEADAERHADDLVAAGFKLTWPYPPPERRYNSDAHLITIPLWRRLNAKRRLSEIVPPEHCAPRLVLSIDDALGVPFTGPVFAKAAGDGATGWGYTVRYCPDRASLVEALEWLRAQDEASVIIEDEAPVVTCWCVALVVEPTQAFCAGAAEQVFASPGRQAGSVIDPENALPAAAAALAVQVGEAARQLGFLGLAGLDIGQLTDGRLIVFDPNFRFNASTPQALLHESAARRAGLPASASFALATRTRMSALCDRLRAPIDEGWFVPTRLLDAALLPAANGQSHVTGFVLGADRADAIAQQDALKALLDR